MTLLEACLANDLEKVKEMQIDSSQLELKDSLGRTPLMIATQNNNLSIVEFLLELGADVNNRDFIN